MPFKDVPEHEKRKDIPTHSGRYRNPYARAQALMAADASEEEHRAQAKEAYARSWKPWYIEAKAKGLWIYDPFLHEWYSPEAFKAQYERYIYTDIVFSRMQIRDPHEGIKAGYEKLAQLQQKHEDLVKRVVEYEREKAAALEKQLGQKKKGRTPLDDGGDLEMFKAP